MDIRTRLGRVESSNCAQIVIRSLFAQFSLSLSIVRIFRHCSPSSLFLYPLFVYFAIVRPVLSFFIHCSYISPLCILMTPCTSLFIHMTPCTYKNRRYIGDKESNKLTTHPLTRNRTRVLPPLSKLDPLHL